MPGWFTIKHAAARLKAGELIAYPTEAVYGLGCDPLNEAAVNALYALKQRPWNKGVILVAADIDQLMPFMAPLSDQALAHLNATWPGPVTWVVPASDRVPPWITGGAATIAVRVSAHIIVRDLCRYAGGPLVSTSANRSSQPPAKSAFAVHKLFGSSLGAIINGATGNLGSPTEIRDLKTQAIIRSST